MKLILPVILNIIGVCLVVLGFNTLDWLLNQYPRGSLYEDMWHLNPYVTVTYWDAYFWFGIIPIGVGSFLVGATSCRFLLIR